MEYHLSSLIILEMPSSCESILALVLLKESLIGVLRGLISKNEVYSQKSTQIHFSRTVISVLFSDFTSYEANKSSRELFYQIGNANDSQNSPQIHSSK